MSSSINYGMGVVCFPNSIEVDQDLVVPYFASLKEKALKDDYTIVHDNDSEPYAVNRSGHRYEIDDIQKSASHIMDFINEDSPKELVAFFEKCEKVIYDHLLMYIEMYPHVLPNIWWTETGHVAAYGAGSSMGTHNDNEVNYQVGFEPDLQLATRHVLSALLYLNSSVGSQEKLGKYEYNGGELEFVYANALHQPKSGDLLIFPSNYLGTHEVKPCLSGERYVYISYFSHGSAHSERGVQPGPSVPVGKQSQVWLPTIVDDYVSYIKEKHPAENLRYLMGGVPNKIHSSSTKNLLPQNREGANE
jgi:hypothetical protein